MREEFLFSSIRGLIAFVLHLSVRQDIGCDMFAYTHAE